MSSWANLYGLSASSLFLSLHPSSLSSQVISNSFSLTIRSMEKITEKWTFVRRNFRTKLVLSIMPRSVYLARRFLSRLSLAESYPVQLLSCQRLSSCRKPSGTLADKERYETSHFSGCCLCRQSAAHVCQSAYNGAFRFPLRILWFDVGQDRTMERGIKESDAVHYLHHGRAECQRTSPSLLLRIRLHRSILRK